MYKKNIWAQIFHNSNLFLSFILIFEKKYESNKNYDIFYYIINMNFY
jgi:hypothetical protein